MLKPLLLLCALSAAPAAAQRTPELHLFSQLLPHTDGYGLLPKPPSPTKAAQAALFEAGKLACDAQCATPFGEMLGEADGVVGYSNCRPSCIRPQLSFLNLKTGAVSIHAEDPKDKDLHYIGVIYQCVEYARRWWMKQRGITFGSVDSAYEILYLTEGKDIRTNQAFPLARSINGTARRSPRCGDLVIYQPTKGAPSWRYGHVAVVVAVDLEAGTASLAEENSANQAWDEPKAYARKVRLFNVGGRYQLIDVAVDQSVNPTGGVISGWVYPLSRR